MKSIYILILIILIGTVVALSPGGVLQKTNSNHVLVLSGVSPSAFNDPAFQKENITGGHYKSTAPMQDDNLTAQAVAAFINGTGSI